MKHKKNSERDELVKMGETQDKEPKVDYDEDEPKEHLCKICGKSFESDAKLQEHIGEHYR